MSWFQDAFLWPKLLFSGDGRDQLKKDIKGGDGTAKMGNPLHGLTAGYKIHEMMSPTVHINDRYHDLQKNGGKFDEDHLKRTRDDNHHYIQDAFKENWPVLVAGAGSAAGGLGSTGGAAGGATGATTGAAGTTGAGLGSGVAGLEGVTVVGSAGGGGLGAGLGAGAGAVGSFMPGSAEAPMEGVTVTGSSGGLEMGAGTEAAMAAAAASQAANGGESDSSWWDKIKDQLQQQGGGQQQQQEQQQQPAAYQPRGLGRQQGFMDKLKSGLFPVDSRAAEAIGPEALAQQRNQALMRMGLGMMSASSQGAGFGESALFGMNTAQSSLDGALQRGYENAREARQEQRVERNAAKQDERYSAEWERTLKQDEVAAARDERNFSQQAELRKLQLQQQQQQQEATERYRDQMLRLREAGIATQGDNKVPAGYRKSATGDLEPIPGGPADPQNKTGNFQEAERTAAFLGTRIADGLKTLQGIPQEDQTPGFMEGAAKGLGSDTAANFVRTDDRQRANAAQRDVLDAALTLATGAAYTNEQIDAMRESYFPQKFDSDKVKADKAARLEMLLQAAKIKSGRAASSIDDVVNKQGGGAQPIKSDAEYDALPSGAEFIGPDGKRRKKP